MPKSNPSKTKSTERDYLKRARSLINKYCTQFNLKNYSPDEHLVIWLESLKPYWLPATWRKNKASIIYYLNIYGFHEIEQLLSKIESDGCSRKRIILIKTILHLKRRNPCQSLT